MLTAAPVAGRRQNWVKRRFMDLKFFNRIVRGAAAFLALATLALALPANAQGVRGIFEVSGVSIDATAASSSDAKAQALLAGRKMAAERLVKRLTLPEDLTARGGMPALTPEIMERVIASYSVSDEKSSSVRYLARLTVEFDAGEVRAWLNSLGLNMIDSRSLALAVFPFAPNAPEPDRVALNQAWRNAGLENELVPLGLSTVAATENAFPAYEAAAKQAGAGGALLATFQAKEEGGRIVQSVTLTKLENGARFELGTAQASAIVPESDAVRPAIIQALMNKAVLAASDLVQTEWKRRNAARGGQPSTTVVTAAYGSIEEWNRIRSSLGKSSLIRNVRVEAISKDNALLTITFTGGQSQLATDVARAGLQLDSTDKGLVLRSRQ